MYTYIQIIHIVQANLRKKDSVGHRGCMCLYRYIYIHRKREEREREREIER